ncbi:translation initiation factor IF-2-like [Aquila chrysaetos chrysaetos]|uniref:translation initiation factor IF-2-like n=1 Tax=Aquila chrysaetos chrysaetos TaxID=223781 RepID=UPI001B7D37AE|nr:translation initiation factor IF-2-like [Aquila chrysaetos chrysaetos]
MAAAGRQERSQRRRDPSQLRQHRAEATETLGPGEEEEQQPPQPGAKGRDRPFPFSRLGWATLRREGRRGAARGGRPPGRGEGWRRRRGAARRPCPGRGHRRPAPLRAAKGTPRGRGAAGRRPRAPGSASGRLRSRRGAAGRGGGTGGRTGRDAEPPAPSVRERRRRLRREVPARLARPANATSHWGTGVSVNTPPSSDWRSRRVRRGPQPEARLPLGAAPERLRPVMAAADVQPLPGERPGASAAARARFPRSYPSIVVWDFAAAHSTYKILL